MSFSSGDLAEEQYYQLLEVKEKNKFKNALIEQFKNDNSKEDEIILEQIRNYDIIIGEYINTYKDDSRKLDDWMKGWQPCTSDYIINLRHMISNWKDLKIGFSNKDINLIRCTHPKWEKEFHAHKDFTEREFIKYEMDEGYTTTEPYQIIRLLAKENKIKDLYDAKKSAVSRINKILTNLFKIKENPISGKTEDRAKEVCKIFTSKIDFYFID